MKRCLIMLGIICFLSFSITGCSDAPDNQDTAIDKPAGNALDAMKSGLEKTKEVVSEAKEEAQQAIEDTKKIAGDVVDAAKEKSGI